jgi:Arylsulfotransferase (ASST)
MARRLQIAAACVAASWSIGASAQTLGLLLDEPGSSEGYTLFSSLQYPEVFLIDNQGRRVHSWPTTFVSGNTNYLLENGQLLRAADPGGNSTFVAGGDGGLLQRLDWDGRIRWQYLYSNAQHRQHHDIAPLPNGNVLILAWEYRSAQQAIDAGRDPETLSEGALWPEHIIEVKREGPRKGKIVWEWHLWDHLIQDFDANRDNFGAVADHPELVDINFRADDRADWLHANAVDYNAELDQILIGARNFDEFWVIDHGTSREEAAAHSGGARGRGGDILYRWGNPRAYRRGSAGDQQLFNPHDPHWIAPGLAGAGHILVFNNGAGRPEGPFSTVDELVTPADPAGHYPVPGPGEPHGPPAPVWTYRADPPTSLYSRGLGSAQRLPNGNTLICEGTTGTFLEVDSAGEVVWVYVNPVGPDGPQTQGERAANATFRAARYPVGFAGFKHEDLTPGNPIELPLCGNDFVDGAELCDGLDDAMCPGQCSLECRCP